MSGMNFHHRKHCLDPIKFARWLWPHIVFYDKEREIIYSVVDNDETIVIAGHMLGKDFTAAFIALWFFMTRHPCRVVTTSVDGLQLEGVLWGEIRTLLQTSKYKLDHEYGGPLVINHMHIRKVVNGELCGKSYLLGRVAAKGEGMQGHHIADVGDGIPRSLYVADEASGVSDKNRDAADTWAARKLAIGNPYPCENFFSRADVQGDQLNGDGTRYYRKVFHLSAWDSPNVQLAEAQIANGKKPTNEIIVPGVMPWEKLQQFESTWDEVRKTIGLHGRFYKGADRLLFPPQWLDRAKRLAKILKNKIRKPKSCGIDPGEGVSDTVLMCGDEFGVIDRKAMKTPNTAVIPREIKSFFAFHNLRPDQGYIDAGDGKQYADFLADEGWGRLNVVGFGSAPTDPNGPTGSLRKKALRSELRLVYKNRRAEMYGTASLMLNPMLIEEDDLDDDGKPLPDHYGGYAIPEEYNELHRQLSMMPKMQDGEGKLYLPPKNKPPSGPGSQIKTITDIIGHSPDEADAFVLMVWGLTKRQRARAGAV